MFLVVLRNFTRNLCMFLDIFEQGIERRRKRFRTNDLWKNSCMCPHNCFEKKCAHKFFFKFYVLLLFCTFFKMIFFSNIWIIPQIFVKQVYLNNFFLFSVQSSKLSRKLRVKFFIATIYPLFTLIFINYFFFKYVWNARLVPKMTFERYWGDESWICLIRDLTSHNFA